MDTGTNDFSVINANESEGHFAVQSGNKRKKTRKKRRFSIGQRQSFRIAQKQSNETIKCQHEANVKPAVSAWNNTPIHPQIKFPLSTITSVTTLFTSSENEDSTDSEISKVKPTSFARETAKVANNDSMISEIFSVKDNNTLVDSFSCKNTKNLNYSGGTNSQTQNSANKLLSIVDKMENNEINYSLSPLSNMQMVDRVSSNEQIVNCGKTKTKQVCYRRVIDKNKFEDSSVLPVMSSPFSSIENSSYNTAKVLSSTDIKNTTVEVPKSLKIPAIKENDIKNVGNPQKVLSMTKVKNTTSDVEVLKRSKTLRIKGTDIKYIKITQKFLSFNDKKNSAVDLSRKSDEQASISKTYVINIERDDKDDEKNTAEDLSKKSKELTTIETQRGIINAENPQKIFQCPECDLKLPTQGKLQSHMRKHTGQRPYKCKLCKRKFKYGNNLKDHLRIHSGEKPYQCKICKVRFVQLSHLNKHLNTHTGLKPFFCEMCNKKFVRLHTLQRHMKIHTGDKKFDCKICGKKFGRKFTLKGHIRTHTGEKPYECHLCEAKFCQSSTLQTHIRTHTGDKPFKCCVCNVRYSDSSQLHKHKKHCK